MCKGPEVVGWELGCDQGIESHRGQTEEERRVLPIILKWPLVTGCGQRGDGTFRALSRETKAKDRTS